MPKKKSLKTLLEYVKSCGGTETFVFATQTEADDYAKELRKLAMEEDDVDSVYKLQNFDIEVGNNIVRIKTHASELVNA
jgi:hypothetical protein